MRPKTAALIAILMPVSLNAIEQEVCQVLSVHDGDTLRVSCPSGHHQIRLYCLDAPELAQAPWGTESRDFLRSRLPKDVLIIPRNTDRYGREVAEVIVSDRNINLDMVEAGSAVAYPKYCRDQAFFRAEQAARFERLGVWSVEGDQQRPWEYRASRRRR